MSCGVPSLLSHIGGNIGALHGDCGAFYFESCNTVDLANMIFKLFEDHETYNKYRKIVRKFVIENYSWEITVKKYLSLI